ncbi:hypothetical protein SUGI_1199870 [Cryptomeria japonica]|uniref:uncharacterized protein LOC131038156 isoform X2 n=1 Tax=Cryptomeria japonica TaxID=3369 RepID=UPI002414AB8D|nr:uncharacterized protein LOC131038156 isoform X2 [Cryptomeria japonica]GLJ55881.1 hypothetical protein SUGI_1199870 [Cryptomeria japonica]
MDPVLSRVEIDPNAPSHSVAIKWIDAMRSAVSVPPQSHDTGFKEALILRHLTVDRVDTGLVLSTLAVKPPITNRYNTLHGGAVASIASIVGLAAVKTVAADKVFFQTEMSMSYLSAGRIGVELEVEAKVLRYGKSVAISSIEIRNKETKQTIYKGRCTYYNMPTSCI